MSNVEKYKEGFDSLQEYVDNRIYLINELSSYPESIIPDLHTYKYKNTQYEYIGNENLEKNSFYNKNYKEIDIENKFPLVTALLDKYLSEPNVNYENLRNVFKEFSDKFLISDWNDFPIEKLIKKHKKSPESLRFLMSLNFNKKMSLGKEFALNGFEYGYEDIKIFKNYFNEGPMEILIAKSFKFLVKDLKEDKNLKRFTKVLVDESFNLPEVVDPSWRNICIIKEDNKIVSERSFKFITKQDSLENYLFRIMFNRIYEYKDIVKYVKESFDKEINVGVFQSFCIENNFLFNENKNFENLKIEIQDRGDISSEVSLILKNAKNEEELALSFKSLGDLYKKLDLDVKDMSINKLVEENSLIEIIREDLIDASTLTSKFKISENRYYTLSEYIEFIEKLNQKNINKLKSLLSDNNSFKNKRNLKDFLEEIYSNDEMFNSLDKVQEKLLSLNELTKIDESFMLNKYLVLLENNLNEKVQKCAIGGIDYSGRELSNFIIGGISSIRQNLDIFGDLSESEKDMTYALSYEAMDKQIDVNNIFKLLFRENNKGIYIINSIFEKELAEKIVSANLIELNKFFKMFAEFTDSQNKKVNDNKDLAKLYNDYNNSNYHYKSISSQNIIQAINLNIDQHLESVLILSKFMKKNKDLAIYNLDSLTNLYNSVALLVDNQQVVKVVNADENKNLEEIEATLLEVIIYAETKDTSKVSKRIKQKF